MIARTLALTASMIALATAQTPTPATNPTATADAVRLAYTIPVDALQRSLQDRPDLDLEQMCAEIVRVVAARVGDAAQVARAGASGFTVDIPAASAARILELRRIIEAHGTLEMRIVASTDYRVDGVELDLKQERDRLGRWLADGGRERVLADSRALASYAPARPDHVKWVVRRIRPDRHDPQQPARWQYAFAQSNVLAPATVPLYGDAEWHDGMVPAALARDPNASLLELVALNMHAPAFTNADLDPAGIGIGRSRDGGKAVNYTIRGARAADYAAWSERFTGHACAIVVDGELLSAPVFRSRIPGRGTIEGNIDDAGIEALAAALRGGELPVAPDLEHQETVPPRGRAAK